MIPRPNMELLAKVGAVQFAPKPPEQPTEPAPKVTLLPRRRSMGKIAVLKLISVEVIRRMIRTTDPAHREHYKEFLQILDDHQVIYKDDPRLKLLIKRIRRGDRSPS